MFDISFGKLLLIGVVALVVLGPERLPTVAKMLGAAVARAQRFVASVKADIRQQANLEGLDQLRQEIHEAASAFQTQLTSEVRQADAEVACALSDIHGEEAAAPASLNLMPAVEVKHAVVECDERQWDLFDEPLPPSRIVAPAANPTLPHQ